MTTTDPIFTSRERREHLSQAVGLLGQGFSEADFTTQAEAIAHLAPVIADCQDPEWCFNFGRCLSGSFNVLEFEHVLNALESQIDKASADQLAGYHAHWTTSITG